MNRPKGTKDIFGKRQEIRQEVIDLIFKIANNFNFKRIETPIFENELVFKKGVGKNTDIVSKEMFLFEDKSKRKMVLRPEGTSGVVRAIIENKLYTSLPLKLFYLGEMFRYENPQKGRQRQFTQFGVEYIGEKNYIYDLEIILFAKEILEKLGLEYKLIINSIGDIQTRNNFSKALKKYFIPFKNDLSKTSQKRLKTNPIRILDDKEDSKKQFVLDSPKINQFYSLETKKYYQKIKKNLDLLNIKFEEKPSLVRGLDYYTDIVFEFLSISKIAGSQNALIAGGRYDNLINNLGGPDINATGFAIGIERLVNELENNNIFKPKQLDTYIINLSQQSENFSFDLMNKLRNNNISCDMSQVVKLRKGLKKADIYNAKIKIIIGENEIKSKVIAIKYEKYRENVKISKLIKRIKEIIIRSKNETN